MTNYQKLCSCVDIYNASQNWRLYDALARASLSEAVNRHIFHPNDELLIDLAASLLPTQDKRIITQRCDDLGWFHCRFNNLDATYWIYCPPFFKDVIPASPDWVKYTGKNASREHAFQWCGEEYARY